MADHPTKAQADREGIMGELQAFGAASQQLNAWIAGEQALGLLRAAQTSGILDAIGTPRTVADIVGVTGVDVQRVADILLALDAHGVVTRDGALYRLAPDFALLSAPDAFQTLPNLLGRASVTARMIAASAAPDDAYAGLSDAEALALAQGAGANPLSPTAVAYLGALMSRLPELRARWEAGARHLEFGCGAGSLLIGFLAAHPRLTAVGVERNGAILPETRRRAVAAGVADRLELRHADARDGAEEAAYDSAFWAQQFFAAADRPATLAALRRALKPGGFLLLTSFIPGEPPASPEEWHTPAGRAHALSRLEVGRWGVPALTIDELRAEVEAAGFAYVRRAPHSTMFMLLFRRSA